MNKFIPNAYKKDIFSINYDKLKEKNIKVILYDFDNTLIEKGNNVISKETIKLINKLQKDFLVYVVSNSMNSKKLKKVCKELSIPFIMKALKPTKVGYKKLKFKKIKNNEIAMIGDQLITDVLGANRMGYYSILIEPINKNELLVTKVNRVFENIILKINNKKIKRGRYYD